MNFTSHGDENRYKFNKRCLSYPSITQHRAVVVSLSPLCADSRDNGASCQLSSRRKPLCCAIKAIDMHATLSLSLYVQYFPNVANFPSRPALIHDQITTNASNFVYSVARLVIP